jgi:hypothetical protein
VAGSCEHSNEASGSVKGEEFLCPPERLLDLKKNSYWFLKEDSAPWN